MLEVLHIRNLALIEDMSLEFSDGINVLSGETGAGKSFILKALGFILGEKLSIDVVRPGADKAQVEALFILGNKELLLRRELMASNGRSRFYINDSLHSQESMRELRAKLISHTSQMAQQKLLQPAFQAALLEREIAVPELLLKRDELLAKYRETDAKIVELQESQAKLAEKRELLEMQKQAIDKIKPQPGEEEELEQLRSKIRNDEGRRKAYASALAILHGGEEPGLLFMLSEFERALAQIAKYDPEMASEIENISSMREQIVSLGSQLRHPPQNSESYDMDEIESRLFAFAQLKRKLRRTMPQILQLKDEIAQNLSFLDVCALDIARLGREKDKYAKELAEITERLLPLRHEAADNFARKLEQVLHELGFSEHVRIVPKFVKQELCPGVFDERGLIMWAPNPGQKPQALDKIASGGELSRFLLGVTTLDNVSSDITYIFDEVDAGVGGLTLNKVGEKLQQLSKEHQVILITHWPQLAARGKTHFQINKTVRDGQTFTQCTPLAGKERKAELARMAGGGPEGKALADKLYHQE